MSTKTSFQVAKNPFISVMTDSCEDLSINSGSEEKFFKAAKVANNNFSALSKIVEPLGANNSKLSFILIKDAIRYYEYEVLVAEFDENLNHLENS